MKSSTNRRKQAHRRGARAEWKSALFLFLKGYRIVAIRHRTKLGEIDLIARKGDLAVMVEVKARPTVQQAVDSVTATARRRINNAADLWLAKQKDAARLSVRFDIIAVCPWKLPVHFIDAF
ncbi:MAG: YraN family protein [Pseudomonadota bacterium]